MLDQCEMQDVARPMIWRECIFATSLGSSVLYAFPGLSSMGSEHFDSIFSRQQSGPQALVAQFDANLVFLSQVGQRPGNTDCFQLQPSESKYSVARPHPKNVALRVASCCCLCDMLRPLEPTQPSSMTQTQPCIARLLRQASCVRYV